MGSKAKGKSKGWNLIDNIQGDKVIWIIVILLILYSIVGIFSATSMNATAQVTRMDLFKSHIGIVLLGVLIIFACYFIGKVGIFRWLSSLGFIGSAALLLVLLFGHHSAADEFGATRGIRIGSFYLQVYEVVKVAMVMYLAWAVHAYKNDSFPLVDSLAKRFGWLNFLSKPWCKRVIFIHIPIVFVTACIMKSGFSSAILIAFIMILTVIVGGIPAKDIGILIAGIMLLVGAEYSLWKATGWKALELRWPTIEARIESFIHKKDISELRPGSREERDFLDSIQQIEGVKIAIKRGGLIGRGPGRSTQKYSVAEIFSDFMFAFIVEEYGILFGAIPLIILYLSLLARGSIIVRYCDNEYARTVVAGLVLLISVQAMLHMFINVGLWPLSGQTLPMVSDGKTSFLAFSFAFGVLLSISKMVKKKVDKAAAEATPLIDHSDDDIRSSLDDLDALESGRMQDDIDAFENESMRDEFDF